MALAALLSLALLAGCGGDSSTDATGGSVTSPATAGVLSLADLPAGASGKGHVAEPCKAMAILQENGPQATASKAFILDGTVLQETIAIYPETSSAAAAFFGLISEARGRCIEASVNALLSGGDHITKGPVQTLDFADQGLLQRFVVPDPHAVFDFVALQSGRCAAALFVSREEGTTGHISTPQLSKTAAQLLKSACPQP